MILIKPLHAAGEYSHSLVVPRQWFIQVGQPKNVKVIVGRHRLVIYPLQAGDDNVFPRVSKDGETYD